LIDVANACVGRSTSVYMAVCTEHLGMKLSLDGDKLMRSEFRSSSADSGYAHCAHVIWSHGML